MVNKSEIESYIYPLAPIPTSLSPQGGIGTRIACILFDIYGTLFISGAGEPGLAGNKKHAYPKIQTIFIKYGVSADVAQMMGRLEARILSAHHDLKKQGVDYPEIRIEDIWMEMIGIDDPDTVRKFAVEFELAVNPVFPMPHVKELLLALAAKNIILGIISNAQFFTPYLFKWFLGGYPETLGFSSDLLFYSFQHGYAKPSEYLFTLALQKLREKQIEAQRILYVGNDMRNDILPAQNSGMHTALFAGDRRSLRLRENDPCCRDLSADIIVTDLLQLLDHL